LGDSIVGQPSIGWLLLRFSSRCSSSCGSAPPSAYRYDQISCAWVGKVLIPVTIVWIGVEMVMAWYKVGPWAKVALWAQ